MMKAILLKIDGTVQEVKPQNGTDFQLDEVYQLLDCDMVEVQQLADGRIMILDENGKHEDAIVNKEATDLYKQGRMSPSEYRKEMRKQHGANFIDLTENYSDEFAMSICGNVIVCSPQMFL